MKVTQWFSGEQKPTRNGWYQRRIMKFIFAYWYFRDGAWMLGGDPKPNPWWVGRAPSPDQSLPWRGLAEKP